MYLPSNANHKSATVFSNFTKAVENWGLPSRTRCDVVKYKLSTCSPGRGSALVGKSMDNQQIECLWWDVFKDVLKNFHELFSLIEDLNILDSLE